MSNNNIVDFSLPATSDHTFTLSGVHDKYLAIYFYPKDNATSCATEAQRFRDLYAEFRKANYEAAGISRDSIKSHENFKAKFTLPFMLLSDTDEAGVQHVRRDQVKEYVWQAGTRYRAQHLRFWQRRHIALGMARLKSKRPCTESAGFHQNLKLKECHASLPQ